MQGGTLAHRSKVGIGDKIPLQNPHQ